MSIVKQGEMSWRGENTEKSTYWCDPYMLVLIIIMRKRKDLSRIEYTLAVAMEMIKRVGNKCEPLQYSLFSMFI